MLSVYPYASGSLYTASYAITASYSPSASYIAYTVSASYAKEVIYPQSGSSGKGICLLTSDQYLSMISLNKMETCTFINI